MVCSVAEAELLFPAGKTLDTQVSIVKTGGIDECA